MSYDEMDYLTEGQEKEYLMYMHGYHALYYAFGKEACHKAIDEYIETARSQIIKSETGEDGWGEEDRLFLLEMIEALEGVKAQIG